MSPSNHRYEQVPLDNHHDMESSRQQQHIHQRTDLEDTFDINEEDEEQEQLNNDSESHQLLPSTTARTSTSSPRHHTTPIPHSNDGVFSNMAAKPESDSLKLEEVPPASSFDTYEEASADATPPYWQTTIIAPAGMGDMVLVEGLPVGNILSFLWNMMVSASFQLVGFMLTYLLHTTHAAKDGARAGLGVSLIQYGFYVRSRGTLDEDFDYDGEGHETVGQDAAQANIIAYMMMLIGWFIILRAVTDYNRARKMEGIINSEPTVDRII